MTKNLKKEKQVVVLPEQNGIRLDALLAPFFESRSQAEKAIKKSLIYRSLNLDDKKNKEQNINQIQEHLNIKQNKKTIITKPSHKVKVGEIYYIIAGEHQSNQSNQTNQLKAYDFPVPILFEDNHLLVINKPAGLPVHPGIGHESDTLVNALVNKTTLSDGTAPLRPGIVHRLDKDVSGLMILSKTKKTEELLIKQFKNKKIHRIYRAITVGKWPSHTESKKFTITSFIGRHPKDRKKFYSFKEQATGTKQAITHCQKLKSYQGKIHLVECQLETGRTHQIRVHLKSQGLPILGDSIYFPLRQQKKQLKQISEALFNNKEGAKAPFLKLFCDSPLALYSAKLKFSHPIDNKTLIFNLPWPKKFHPLLNQTGME